MTIYSDKRYSSKRNCWTRTETARSRKQCWPSHAPRHPMHTLHTSPWLLTSAGGTETEQGSEVPPGKHYSNSRKILAINHSDTYWWDWQIKHEFSFCTDLWLTITSSFGFGYCTLRFIWSWQARSVQRLGLEAGQPQFSSEQEHGSPLYHDV
jgi:hypothetical protein